MNNIERLITDAEDAGAFAKGYIRYLSDVLNRIDVKCVAAFIEELEEARRNNNTIFIAGNGGSAATASHMANDIGMDVLKKGGSSHAFRALALTENASVMTAIANDDGYANVFVNQLRIHYQEGDKLIVISASGNSPNVIEAAKWVKARGGKIIGLVGFDGGKLKEACDVVIHAETPKGEYGPVEDSHHIMNHLVANWLQYRGEKERHLRKKGETE